MDFWVIDEDLRRLPRHPDTGLVLRPGFERAANNVAVYRDVATRAASLTRIAIDHWQRTGDPWWICQIAVIDERLSRIGRPGGRQHGRAGVRRYHEWRDLWIEALLEWRKDAPLPVALLTPAQRRNTRAAWARAQANAATARRPTQWELWQAKAARYKKRLLDDAIARYYALRRSPDGRQAAASRTALRQAQALGWDRQTPRQRNER